MNLLWGKDARLLDQFQPQKGIKSREIIWCGQFHHPWNIRASLMKGRPEALCQAPTMQKQ
jgi:hypothetical protein